MKLVPFLKRSSNRWHGKYVAGLMTAFAGVLLSVGAAGNEAVGGGLIDGTRAPKEVQDLVAAYLKDSTGSMSFTQSIEWGSIDPSIKLSEIEAETPVHEYDMNIKKILNEKDSIPISFVVKPINSWQVPIRARSKYLYIITIQKLKGHFSVVGMSGASQWESVRTLWPESSGYIPILINIRTTQLLHFPQIDDYNLVTLRRGYKLADSVAIAFDESTGDNNASYISPGIKNKSSKIGKLPKGAYLSDSKRIFKYLKRRESRIEFLNYKNLPKVENTK
jgi:hypothetical protein